MEIVYLLLSIAAGALSGPLAVVLTYLLFFKLLKKIPQTNCFKKRIGRKNILILICLLIFFIVRIANSGLGVVFIVAPSVFFSLLWLLFPHQLKRFFFSVLLDSTISLLVGMLITTWIISTLTFRIFPGEDGPSAFLGVMALGIIGGVLSCYFGLLTSHYLMKKFKSADSVLIVAGSESGS